jgi:hypothetical protein
MMSEQGRPEHPFCLEVFDRMHHWDHTYAVRLFRDKELMRNPSLPLVGSGCLELIATVITMGSM